MAESADSVSLEIGVRHALIVSFALGILVGGSAVSMITGLSMPASGSGVGGDDGPSPVRLQNTDFRFPDINQGVGSGNVSWENGTVSLEGEPYIGSEDAPVTIVSYEDFECPFCDRYNKNAFPQIVQNHVANGEARYFYKHLPLTQIHPWAQPAAVAAECAEEQDPPALWIFKQGFFNNQDRLSNVFQADRSVFDESMVTWAGQLGLDTKEFRSCYENSETQSQIQADVQEARQLGATGTPTIFINGKKIVGAQPYSAFGQVINSELS